MDGPSETKPELSLFDCNYAVHVMRYMQPADVVIWSNYYFIECRGVSDKNRKWFEKTYYAPASEVMWDMLHFCDRKLPNVENPTLKRKRTEISPEHSNVAWNREFWNAMRDTGSMIAGGFALAAWHRWCGSGSPLKSGYDLDTSDVDIYIPSLARHDMSVNVVKPEYYWFHDRNGEILSIETRPSNANFRLGDEEDNSEKSVRTISIQNQHPLLKCLPKLVSPNYVAMYSDIGSSHVPPTNHAQVMLRSNSHIDGAGLPMSCIVMGIPEELFSIETGDKSIQELLDERLIDVHNWMLDAFDLDFCKIGWIPDPDHDLQWKPVLQTQHVHSVADKMCAFPERNTCIHKTMERVTKYRQRGYTILPPDPLHINIAVHRCNLSQKDNVEKHSKHYNIKPKWKCIGKNTTYARASECHDANCPFGKHGSNQKHTHDYYDKDHVSMHGFHTLVYLQSHKII